MGGCASKDKKAENGAAGVAENDAEGCVSNSMVFLARLVRGGGVADRHHTG